MSDTPKQSNLSGQEKKLRRPYSPPQLREYGPLQDLTAAGSAGDPEQGKGGGQDKKRP